MSSRIVLPVCFLSCLSLSSAYARGKAGIKEKPETLDKAAKKACATGDFRKGVEILADLYIQTDDANYVYNQGRCYEQNHRWRDAIDRFLEYQRKARNLPEAVQTEVEKHIADCKLFLEEEATRTTPPPPPVPALPPPPPIAPTTTLAVPQPPPHPPAPAPQPGSAMRTTGIIAAGFGIATLAAAIGLNLKANSLADDASRTQDPAIESSQKSYKTGSTICYGVGGVALLTGTTLYLIGRAKASAASQGLALSPTWGPSEAGVMLSGRF
jgi:hypothetical protein